MLPLASILGLVFCSLNGGHHDDDDDDDMNRRHSPEIKKNWPTMASYCLLFFVLYSDDPRSNPAGDWLQFLL